MQNGGGYVVISAGYSRYTNRLCFVLLRLKAREERMKKKRERRKRVSMKKGKMMVTALMVTTHSLF